MINVEVTGVAATEAVAAAAQDLTCSTCGATTPKPGPCQYEPLWQAGWRWLGTHQVYSCPACPPVVLVDEKGRHLLGPGAATGTSTAERDRT